MCFGNGAAEQANQLAQKQWQDQKKQEEERKANIAAGRTKIDSAFSNFNDGYYNTYKNNYLDFYNPQLDKQFGNTNRSLTYALAGRGLLDSSVGAEAVGDLFKRYLDEKSNVTGAAQDAANQLKSGVESTKSNLYTLNESASDPQTVANRAIGEASAIAMPQSYTPLQDVFASALTPWTNYLVSSSNSAGNGSSGYYRPSGSSYAVVK